MNYKSSTILKVNGSIITEGKYKSNDGTEVNFTPELITKIFSKVNDHVPLYLLHDGAAGPRIPAGYAYKVGINEAGSKFVYNGFVFDKNTMSQIELAGLDKGSAEIDFEFDEQGNAVDGTLTGIAFVPNPAIMGTNVSTAAVVFSRQTNSNSSSEGNMTDDKSDIEKQLNETRQRELEFSQKLEDEKKAHEETRKKFSSLEADYKALGVKYTNLLEERVKTLSTEVKGLGFSAPETLVEGLDIDNQVAVLTRIKTQFSAPGMVPPKDAVNVPGTQAPKSGDKKQFSQDENVAAAAKELGLTLEEIYGEHKNNFGGE